jgi:DNA invertase Pin-like site-specific DNA recombinase
MAKMKALNAYNVGLYLRLSKDDRKKEGMSIENQDELLTNYVERLNKQGESSTWQIIDRYIDVDFTGLNFERPELERLFRDLKAKRINCVMVKSVDRFGRGSKTEDMMEEHFTIPQVRFIALGENIDTIDGIGDLIGFLHAMNGLYPKLVSGKVRQVKKNKAELGKFIGSQANYGYMKSPTNKHLLILDPYSSQVVLQIFKDYKDCGSARLVAEGLNATKEDSPIFYYYRVYKDGAIPPTVRKKRRNSNEYYLSEPKNQWGSATVTQLLKNEVYIGNIINGKREIASIKTKQIRTIDPEDWVRVEGMHEAIVPLDLWQTVQDMLQKKHRVYSTKRTGTPGIFAGRLLCADCERPLAYMNKTLKSGDKGVYRCSQYNNNGGAACTPHYIDEADLIEYVLNDIKAYGVLTQTERENLTKRLLSAMSAVQSKDSSVLEVRIIQGDSRLKDITAALTGLYLNLSKGIIDEAEYKSLKVDLNKEKADIESYLPRLRRELEQLQEVTLDIDAWLALINKCLDMETLDRETVGGLVNSITVHERVKQNGKTTQDIEISYRFIGSLLSDKAKEGDDC